jgi:Family of unknown function (DUF6328)
VFINPNDNRMMLRIDNSTLERHPCKNNHALYTADQIQHFQMSSKSEDDDDDPVMRSSTERYDRVGANLDWFIILASASSIFFGFLLNIAVDPPLYFTFFDNVILLAALYAVTVATAMFILPVIFHASHYRKLDVERFLLRAKGPVLTGIFCVMLAMYLGLGLAFSSKLPILVAYSLPSFPFIFICFELFRHMHE